MWKDYVLMNGDVPLTVFSLVDNGTSLVSVSRWSKVNESPFVGDALTALLDSRKPAMHRAHISELLNLMQIKTATGYFDVSYGLSLNDTLWVRPYTADSSITWESINLYDNPFNDVIAHYAFSGVGLGGLQLSSASPEFGTNGALPKCWHRGKDGSIYLYKGGSTGASNAGNEPYSEYMCSCILKEVGMNNFVPYTLKNYHGHLVSACKLFTSKSFGYLPLCRYENLRTFEEVIKLFDALGMREQFDDLMVFDALIYNTDRHLNNYGFIIDNKTFRPLRLAPMFDNGAGMFPYYTMDKDIDKYACEHDYQNSGLSGDDILSLCLQDRHKKMIARLHGFKFPKHTLFDMPTDRVERLEALLQKRVWYILRK